MSRARIKRSWFKPTRRRVVLFAALVGVLSLMSAAPEPLIRYNGLLEDQLPDDSQPSLFRRLTPD